MGCIVKIHFDLIHQILIIYLHCIQYNVQIYMDILNILLIILFANYNFLKIINIDHQNIILHLFHQTLLMHLFYHHNSYYVIFLVKVFNHMFLCIIILKDNNLISANIVHYINYLHYLYHQIYIFLLLYIFQFILPFLHIHNLILIKDYPLKLFNDMPNQI